jgi:hypothetical protein
MEGRMNTRKRVTMVIATGAIVLGMSSAAAATGCPPKKCNSGRGNGSEVAPGNDCDPGNSGAHNNGGD